MNLIIKIYLIASIVYSLYYIFLFIYYKIKCTENKNSFSYRIKHDTQSDPITIYNSINLNRLIVFIIGIIIGCIYVFMFNNDNNIINEELQLLVSDVNDIYVK
jgi:hypothetical protein